MGKIKVTECVCDGEKIEGLYVIEPTVFKDERGYFMETYNKNDFTEAGLSMDFVQDNQSCSVKGVLRGLHYQKEYPQGKLVRAIRGTVFDVAVDLRQSSETYGKWYGVELSEENKKMFLPTKGDFLPSKSATAAKSGHKRRGKANKGKKREQKLNQS